MDCSTPGFPVHHQLPEFAQTHVHRVSDAIQPSHPLSSPSPPTFNLSQHQGLFQWVSSSHQMAKVLEFQLQHQSFQWIFKTDFLLDWLVWSLAVQGTLKSLLQHHSSKALILQCSGFFIVQLLYLYMTTRKTIALTRRTFVGKVMSLLFNMLSRLVIAFLPRSKHLLNFIAAVTICHDFGVQENKLYLCFHCFPIYLPWSDRTRTVVLEQTLESPLGSKEIQPVHPKGNQSWIFIGRTDAEAETPIFWPPDTNWLIGKDPDDGKDWKREEKGTTEDEMVGWHHRLKGHDSE